MSTRLCNECWFILKTITKRDYEQFCCYPFGDCDHCGKEIPSLSGAYLPGTINQKGEYIND